MDAPSKSNITASCPMDRTDSVGPHETETENTDDAAVSEHGVETARAAESSELKECDDVEVKEVGRGVERVDDFVRNFCVRHGMLTTLNAFEDEWLDLKTKSSLTEKRFQQVPDQYTLNIEEIDRLRKTLNAESRHLEAEKKNVLKLQKERDAHRLHYKRVAHEKNTISEEIKRLKQQCNAYEPRIRELQRKYEQQLKEKSMISIEKEKIQQKLEAVEIVVAENASPKGDMTSPAPEERHRSTATFQQASQKRDVNVGKWERLQIQDFDGHMLSVSNLAMHPLNPIVASVSDDRTWKLWQLDECELMMTGEGHTDWISGVDFHPQGRREGCLSCKTATAGTSLATGSGDGTVKLWNFEKRKCVKTFSENQAVWSVKFYETGQMLATASLDRVARLWDLVAEKNRAVFRGHGDSVNQVAWQPGCPVLCTASSDRTVALWDARTGRRHATLCGHSNSCNHCCFSDDGRMIASCDSDGTLKTWDVWTMREIASIRTSPASANQCAFDKSGTALVVACGDGSVRCCDPQSGHMFHEFSAHEGSVLSVLCDANNTALLTSGSDHCIKCWFCKSS